MSKLLEGGMNHWMRKLAAYLHDPPGKPFNLKEHCEVAETLLRELEIEPEELRWFFDKVCDHTAAAADRLAFPRSALLRAEFRGDGETPFRHPLGGGTYAFESPAPSATFAEERVHQALKKLLPSTWPSEWVEEPRSWAKFFIVWRFWPEYAAKLDPRINFLPADTRIPDHTTWTHCSLVSALQTCVEIIGDGDAAEVREFKPAFLLFQLGPVQEFIAQARTTRDLWSGSYLLSWIIAHAMKAVTDVVGPDCMLFPSLRGQPIFDLLHKQCLYEKLGFWTNDKPLHAPQQILTPTLPNRFLAVVPEMDAESLATQAKDAAEDALKTAGKRCRDWLKENGCPLPDTSLIRWDQQIGDFLQVTWQTSPWEIDVDKAIETFAKLPAGKYPAAGDKQSPEESLKNALSAATHGIERNALDHRNYASKSWQEAGLWKSKLLTEDGRELPPGQPALIDNPGFAWSAHYAMVDYLLAARRNLRDFKAWGDKEDDRFGTIKDQFSGKEEAIAGPIWFGQAANLPGHLIRAGEHLGAVNLIKRVWHLAVLAREPYDLWRTPRFDSLPSIAAAGFVVRTIDELEENADAWQKLLDFQKAASAARGDFPAEISEDQQERKWLNQSDASIFHVNEWRREISARQQAGANQEDAIRRLENARDALSELLGDGSLNRRPGAYVAVLALDGDSMGQWISGAKSPKFREQVATEVCDYFSKDYPKAIEPNALRRLLDTSRHLSPSYHLQFSEALANFGLYLASIIVEVFNGQLIFSGGDDVLAMLPSECALPCARALRMAFRGDPDLWHLFDSASDFNSKTSHSPVLPGNSNQYGFVSLNSRLPVLKRRHYSFPVGYTFLVPGRNADVSAGIAIGHIHSPLQNLVEAARDLEKLAKRDLGKGGYGKSAFAMGLFKRSGEEIAWGAKWDDGSIELTEDFRALSHSDDSVGEPVLSSRFPYVLATLLEAYTRGPQNGHGWKFKDQFAPWFERELDHVLAQQSNRKRREKDADARRRFDKFATDTKCYFEKCRGRRLNDVLGPFLTTAFIHRGGE